MPRTQTPTMPSQQRSDEKLNSCALLFDPAMALHLAGSGTVRARITTRAIAMPSRPLGNRPSGQTAEYLLL
jgi:hypothetical protein